MAASIVVADDDLWILRMIATILERRGHTVAMAEDGQEALALAVALRPDLVITDINMPRMDGWDLIRALRDDADLAAVPVVVLSEVQDDDSRVRGYKLGVEDYVAKPFRFEELDLRVERILHRLGAPAAQHRDPPKRHETEPGMGPSVGLVGTLDQVGLSSLLTLLELDRKTGVLTLTREVEGGTEEGRISIAKGRCRAAELLASEAAQGDAECVYRLLSWATGRFEFNQQPVDVEDRIGRSTTGLLMEAARIADESSRGSGA